MSRMSMVCVIDDDEQVLAGLERLLSVKGYEVGVFSSAEHFLKQAESVPHDAVVLADVCMPGVDGIELTRRLRGIAHSFPVVIMTGQGSMRTAVQALRAGAADFVEKPFNRDELFEAIERARSRVTVSRPDRIVPADLARRIESLSPREREVMKLMIAGETSKIIARELGISPRTVEVHRSHVLQKMAARNLADLIHRSAQLGIHPAT